MSYLDRPQITFSGQFQADVSTVNNDPRHFDNASFEGRFQQFQTKASMNGWWNPIGTGIFRFRACQIRSAVGPDGRAEAGPLTGFLVGNSPERPSGKIVDLDPDWQLASQLYGLAVSLVDPVSGRLALLADFDPAPFRDLWFTRGGGAGDSGASAYWQSQLSNLRWDLDGLDSPVLRALEESSRRSDRLSIRIATFGYQTSVSQPNFTYGTLVGALGPVLPGEPKTFISGRRFMPNGANGPGNAACTAANGMTCFSAKVEGDRLVADLSNALPIADDGKLAPLGQLYFALLRRPEITEASLLHRDEYLPIGALDGSEAGLYQRGGIQSLPLPRDVAAHIHELPLALVSLESGPAGDALVMMREVPDGRDVRADDFSFRLDPNLPELNIRTVELYATRYGQPLADAAISLQPGPPAPDTGDAPGDPTPGTTPTAEIPITNTPVGLLRFDPPVPVTDELGRARVRVLGPTVMGTPREYLDGQLYAVAYNFADGPATIMQTFDQLSILVFSTFRASDPPTWEELQPVLRQYANLYPIMSKGLFDFSIQAIADANAHLLYFVLSKPVTDPDHMPVTRDLSEGKRRALLRYFEAAMGRSTVHTADLQVRALGRCPFSGVTPSEPPEDVPNKIIFNRLRSR